VPFATRVKVVRTGVNVHVRPDTSSPGFDRLPPSAAAG
jgi:hypothetical protein